MVTRTVRPWTLSRGRSFVRVSLLLWVSLSLGILALLIFGEMGLLVSLLFHLITLVLAIKIILNDYRRAHLRASKATNRTTLFIIDALSGATLMLGIVVKVASANYGHIYEFVGVGLICFAALLSTGSLVWAIVDYYRTKDKLTIIIAFTFTWISLLGSLSLLMQPASFWSQ